MPEPIFALKIGPLSFFCFNSNEERLHDQAHELVFESPQRRRAPASALRSQTKTDQLLQQQQQRLVFESPQQRGTPAAALRSQTKTDQQQQQQEQQQQRQQEEKEQQEPQQQQQQQLLQHTISFDIKQQRQQQRQEEQEQEQELDDENEQSPSAVQTLRQCSGVLLGNALAPGQPLETAAVKLALASMPEPQAAAPPASVKVDLSGCWLLARVEGDFDAFMKDIGINWVKRNIAKGLNYGVGKVMDTITMTGDLLEIASSSPVGTHTASLRIDGTDQRTMDPVEKTPVISTPRWEPGFGAVCIQVRREKTGEALPTSRRFLLGEEMCAEVISPAGTVVQRFYARQAGGAEKQKR